MSRHWKLFTICSQGRNLFLNPLDGRTFLGIKCPHSLQLKGAAYVTARSGCDRPVAPMGLRAENTAALKGRPIGEGGRPKDPAMRVLRIQSKTRGLWLCWELQADKTVALRNAGVGL